MPAHELFNGTELLGRMAMERMLAGVSIRRYPVALEPVGQAVEDEAKATSKSAVPRKFMAMTETALADLLAADLSSLDLVALMVDGVHFGDHLCVVAPGIDVDGVKHPLAVVEPWRASRRSTARGGTCVARAGFNAEPVDRPALFPRSLVAAQ
jgi:hypothetical protein